MSIIFTLNRWLTEHPAELQLKKAIAFEAFIDLNLSINNGTVSTKYMRRGMILILFISLSLMAMSLGVPPKLWCLYI